MEALVEYQLPLTSKRADVVLCGRDPRTGAPSYVVVELKQWTRALLLDGTDDVCVLEGMEERLHPAEQVRRYCSHLLDFAAVLEPSSGVESADQLLGTAVRPSKQLLALAAEEVLIVSGGPGSGKSVIALSLMGELSRRGRTVLHATGSSAFTQTLRKVAGRRQPRVHGMFKYFNQFAGAERNGIDVLILDEAHRLRETSANRYTRAELRSGRPQVEELIDAARVPVFLLDEHQVVRPGEIGTVNDIEQAAKRLGLESRLVELDGQFRCGGSRAYEHWVLRLLGLEGDGPVPWEGDENVLLQVAEAPSEMEARMRTMLDSGYGARLATAVEQQEAELARRSAGHTVLGERPGRFRPGRLRLHGAGLRVRLLRGDHGS